MPIGKTQMIISTSEIYYFNDILTSHQTLNFYVFKAETVNKLTSLPGSENCGISGAKTGRIVGGEPAKLGKNIFAQQIIRNYFPADD